MIESPPPLLLASASPRRRELLENLGLRFEVVVPDIDESPLPAETPEAQVSRLARGKAEAIAARHPGHVVLAADTIVVCDGEPLGKPRDAADAAGMLRRLSGREHRVMSAVAVIGMGRVEERLSVTRVWMRGLGGDEIERYCAGGEPLDKAGAYAIQGQAAAFVSRLDGSHSGVVGLPLFETLESLAAFGIRPCGPRTAAGTIRS